MYPPLFNQSLNILLLYYKQHGVAHGEKCPELSTPSKTSGNSIISHARTRTTKKLKPTKQKGKKIPQRAQQLSKSKFVCSCILSQSIYVASKHTALASAVGTWGPSVGKWDEAMWGWSSCCWCWGIFVGHLGSRLPQNSTHTAWHTFPVC